MDPEHGILKPEPQYEDRVTVMRKVAASLHDLCQPLTALQCRLEIGQLLATPAAYEEAVMEGLRESERLVASVTAMRELVRQALEETSHER